MAAGTWIDPAQARLPLGEFVVEWRKSIVDLRPTSLARIDSAVANQILPEWGTTALSGIANADVRAWAAQLHAGGYSASTVRKAVFTLRRILAAAVADRRLAINAAEHVPLPVEEPGEQRYLTAEEVELLAETIAPRFRAMVLVAAYGGMRFGELTALRRERVDILRGRVQVAENLVQVGADLSFGPTKTPQRPAHRAAAAACGGGAGQPPGAVRAGAGRCAGLHRPAQPAAAAGVVPPHLVVAGRARRRRRRPALPRLCRPPRYAELGEEGLAGRGDSRV
ncbi:hypothetical protein BH23ACT8_BH23ACT8_12280 [soil metagenome]